MRVLFLTNEYPPHIYGGAGVHVEYLSRELARLLEVEVRCFGDQKMSHPGLTVRGFSSRAVDSACPEVCRPVFGALDRCLQFNAAGMNADLVHCHTWYSYWGGILAKQNFGIPLVATVHSLEPLRPWKEEQIGRSYQFTCWLEKTALEMADAVIAVSEDTRHDVERLYSVDASRLHVIHNGIDLDEYRRVEGHGALKRHGVNPHEPYVLFVGRITRQKGIIHLVNAIRHMNPGFQVVLCAGAPDTQGIAAEMKAAVASARQGREGVFWIEEMLDAKSKVEFYSHASVFVCPSIYESFGIINLEAMACEVPVVATNAGGIREVVVHDETGFLIPIEPVGGGSFEPSNPARFAHAIAERVNELMADPARRLTMGQAGRRRSEERFGWLAIARQTADLYRQLLTQNT